MNISKLIILTICLLGSGFIIGQNSEPIKEDRIVVVVEDQAAIASLDTSGAIAQVIMLIPEYFDEDFDDAHYIAQSLKKTPLKTSVLNKTQPEAMAKVEPKSVLNKDIQ